MRFRLSVLFRPLPLRLALILVPALILSNLQGSQITTGDLVAPFRELQGLVALVRPGYGAEGVSNLFRRDSGPSELIKTLERAIQDPETAHRLGITTQDFKATWYLANPFELLPEPMKQAIRGKNRPFRTRRQAYNWLTEINAPRSWRKALRQAFIETTPENLWRASQGLPPYTSSGEFLKPIAIESANGELALQSGHVAVDPRVIPRNSDLLLIIEANNQKRYVLAKASDTGGAIKGRHIDLPVELHPLRNRRLPHLRFPKEFGNPRVTVVLLGKLVEELKTN